MGTELMKTVSCQHIILLCVCRAGDLLQPAAAGLQGELRGAALLPGPGQARAAGLGQGGESCQCIA